MSVEEDIQKRIEIIFNKEYYNLKKNLPFYYREKLHPPDSNLSESHHRMVESSLTSSDEVEIVWDTFTALKKLFIKYAKDHKSREIFIKNIKERSIELQLESQEISYHDISSLAFYFILKIGNTKDIIEIIQYRRKNILFDNGLYNDISKFMYFESSYFNDDIYFNLEESISECFLNEDIIDKIKSNIFSIRFEKLQNELDGINEELNIHKEQIIEKISNFGFPQEMETFLLDIDRISELPNWKLINSGMISNLRSFFEKLIENIACKIKSKKGDDYPDNPNKSPIGNKREYIKNNLNLSKNDNKLINSYIDILHAEGGHAFLSEKKYFMLTKNIGIEIAYFLLSKLEDFYKN